MQTRCRIDLQSRSMAESPNSGRPDRQIEQEKSDSRPQSESHDSVVEESLSFAIPSGETAAMPKGSGTFDVSDADGFKLGGEVPQIPDYEIIGKLGRGGMGIVYEAEHLSLGRRVALKIVPQSLVFDELSVKRFDLEARTIAKLQHDHIVPVYEVGCSGRIHFYTMRLIDGEGLDKVVRNVRGRIDESGSVNSDRRKVLGQMFVGGSAAIKSDIKLDSSASGNLSSSGALSSRSSRIAAPRSYYHQIAEITSKVARALAYAHGEGVIHRDIKPSNLMLDSTGKVWVTDFGLAKTDQSDLTTTGSVLGTLRFMAPENLEGICDRRSDIYSLGVTLYELLVLQPAFRTRNQVTLIEKILNDDPPRLESIDGGIPRDLQTIVEKAIEKDAKHRYQTADEFAERP